VLRRFEFIEVCLGTQRFCLKSLSFFRAIITRRNRVRSAAVYFTSCAVFWRARNIQTTSKSVNWYHTPKHLVTDLLSNCCCQQTYQRKRESVSVLRARATCSKGGKGLCVTRTWCVIETKFAVWRGTGNHRAWCMICQFTSTWSLIYQSEIREPSGRLFQI